MPHRLRSTFCLAGLLALAASGARADTLLQPVAAEAGGTPPPPWEFVGLPHQRAPQTRFGVVDADGRRALRIEAESSYGNLVHPLHLPPEHLVLSWAWRVDAFAVGTDLTRRDGDDNAVKVCVLFDLPMARVPFVERQLLRVARVAAGRELPAASVCYVWDAHLPAGTELPNAFTHRIRTLVLRGGEAGHGWLTERRDVAADFLRLFGSESEVVPDVIGVAVGADADNTHGHSVALVADLVLAH